MANGEAKAKMLYSKFKFVLLILAAAGYLLNTISGACDSVFSSYQPKSEPCPQLPIVATMRLLGDQMPLVTLRHYTMQVRLAQMTHQTVEGRSYVNDGYVSSLRHFILRYGEAPPSSKNKSGGTKRTRAQYADSHDAEEEEEQEQEEATRPKRRRSKKSQEKEVEMQEEEDERESEESS